jgi:hypothetical protein
MDEDAEMQATALSARLENLRDRRLEAFMRARDELLALAGCGACKIPRRFCGGVNEPRSLKIGRCSARVGNYSRTTVVGHFEKNLPWRHVFGCTA